MDLDREVWLKNRQKGIGGTDVAPILGVSHWKKTAGDIFDEKTAQVIVDDPENPDKQRGIVLEPIAIQQYRKKSGRKVRSQPIRVHKDYPFLRADVDGQQVGDPRGPGILEVKVPRMPTFQRVKHHGLIEDYILQIQHYLEVYGYSWGTFVVFNADSWQVVYFDIERDGEIAEKIVKAGKVFWLDHVLQNIRPADSAPAEIKLPEVKGEVLLLDDPEFQEAMQDLFEARQIMDTAKDLKKVTDAKVKALVKEHLGGLGVVKSVNEDWIVHYKKQDGKVTFQKDALERAGPVDPLLLAQSLKDQGVSLDVISTAIDTSRMDLTQFNKQGNDYETFKPYRLKQRTEE
jgi:putative phage-type endonuclease